MPPDPDRLSELHRQRALVLDQLAWLEREIAAISSQSTPNEPKGPTASVAFNRPSGPANSNSTTSAPQSVFTTAAPQLSVNSPAPPSAEEADAILDQYRVAPSALQQGVRRGCALYFVGAVLLFALGVAGLYFALRKR